ncbi:helix-turn-helix domain-containing protein [Burkholderia ambifaria]|uniref:helix-turn-helix domain-containing protein n=1 Tax=Burkholderia ambifaria TaxID=152480 RepID=UPI001E53FFAF|nr:helix-turn-helix domain-containing protein [Burkholderia ambifaria]UEP49629.1 helix-turn-helix domain-containing protein [Burkholderia ambifaria]
MSRFIVLPSRILEDARLSSMTHLRVLMALGSHTDKHGWAWPSRKTLAEKVGVSTARVSQCIGDLRDWGYIEVYAQTRDSDGGQTSNRYRVLFDIGAPEPVFDADTPPVSDAYPPVSGTNAPVNPMGLPPRKSHGIYPKKVPMNDPLKRIHSAGAGEGGDEAFEEAWAAYPKRAGGNSKRDAQKAWNARLAAGELPGELIAGTKRYAAFCAATGKLGTEFVKLAATFFGPSRHFAEDWTLPTEQASSPAPTRQRNDRSAAAAAIFPNVGNKPTEYIDV